jgi:RNA-directed DNA polymerase
VISPLLSNVFLHSVLDEWFAEQVQVRLRGPSTLVRFCDDFVMVFAHKEDAQRVLTVLGKRLEKFGLQLHPDKTRLVDFRPVRNTTGATQDTLPTNFVFLGFIQVWGLSRKGSRVVRQFTAKERFARSLKAATHQCKKMMHWPLADQYARLCRMLQGHYGYFGITGNYRRLSWLHKEVQRVWYRWLRRRTSKHHLNWDRFGKVLKRFVLPIPRIIHQYANP